MAVEYFTSVTGVKEATDLHIRQFSFFIKQAKAGVVGYRLQECEKYLHIWKSIESDGYKWGDLNAEQANELIDYWLSEDMITNDEAEKLNEEKRT